MESRAPDLRIDIQALRGLAVLLVVLHHANLGPFHGGYLGVDIFFVVSGFLITGIVKRQIEANSFSFVAFYVRRAKRLLPAAYATFLGVALASPFLLTRAELNDLVAQMLGAVTFSANIALWRQTDYFGGAAALKPLLHIWSLSLEEQYYLALPALLFFCPPRRWKLLAGLAVGTSLLLCLTFVDIKPTATFYLLPTRAWELGLGSMAALGMMSGPVAQRVVKHAFWPSLLALLVLPMSPVGRVHPGLDAVLVCVATTVILLRRHVFLDRVFVAKWLAKVGDFSYSLYLVHWPILAFVNNATLDVVPSLDVRIACVAAAFLLGFTLYRTIEKPMRHGAWVTGTPRLLGTVLSASILLMGGVISVARANDGGPDYAHELRFNHGLDQVCTDSGPFVERPECITSTPPRILVWGDSHAMHLLPGIAATTASGVVQATRILCGPFIGYAPINQGNQNAAWVKECMDFNDSVFTYLARTPSIDTVVLSSALGQYLGVSSGGATWDVATRRPGGGLVRHEPSLDLMLQGLSQTVTQIRALGKRVIVVAPPPLTQLNIGRCLERSATHKLSLGMTNPDCENSWNDADRHQAPVLAFLKRLPEVTDAPVVDFRAMLCTGQRCASQVEGTFIYRDEQHLSYSGSRLLVARSGIGALLRASD
jgi:peptidoglycan/LPS O-acetylase OafA/YrhL